MYKYVFDSDKCWYNKVCKKYDTEECRGNCKRFMEMDYLFYKSGIPKRLQRPIKLYPCKSDLPAFHELNDIKNDIESWVKEGNNLFIGSSICGNGKTTWAIKLMCSYFDKVWAGNCFTPRGLFINVCDLLMEFKLGINDTKIKEGVTNILKLAETVDLVIFDDIADVSFSKYEYQIIYKIINNRINDGKSNIYTSNFLDRELENNIGTRLYSRIYNNSKVIELVGKDRRSYGTTTDFK